MACEYLAKKCPETLAKRKTVQKQFNPLLGKFGRN